MDEKSVEILAAVFLTSIMGVLVCRILLFETETNANFYLFGVVVGITAAFLLKKNVELGYFVKIFVIDVYLTMSIRAKKDSMNDYLFLRIG